MHLCNWWLFSSLLPHHRAGFTASHSADSQEILSNYWELFQGHEFTCQQSIVAFLKESPSFYPRSRPLPTNLLSAAFYVGIQTLFCIRHSCKYCCLFLRFFLCTDSQILLLACLTYHVSLSYYFWLKVQITGPGHFQRARKIEWSFHRGFCVPTDFKVLSLVFILKCICVQLYRTSFYL